MEVDESYVWQAFSHKFRGFCRCRCRSGYGRPQELKVLFQGVCYTLGILNQKISNPRRSSSGPPAPAGLQSSEEDIEYYSIGRRIPQEFRSDPTTTNYHDDAHTL